EHRRGRDGGDSERQHDPEQTAVQLDVMCMTVVVVALPGMLLVPTVVVVVHRVLPLLVPETRPCHEEQTASSVADGTSTAGPFFVHIADSRGHTLASDGRARAEN